MGCFLRKKTEERQSEKIFSHLKPAVTGIQFKNQLVENDSLNYFTYSYLYMGGGVATGDINNDGFNTSLFYRPLWWMFMAKSLWNLHCTTK